MAENSKIEWTDHTFNPWIGCTKVSEGCKHCYAEALMDKRYGRAKWGPQGTRVRTSAANWRNPLQWNKDKWFQCSQCSWRGSAKEVQWSGFGEPLCPECFWGWPMVETRQRVFCASLADVFEEREELAAWRADLGRLILETPNLDWLILTKRPENVFAMCAELGWVESVVPDEVAPYIPGNVWLGTSVENQAQADVRIPALLNIPAQVRFLSMEPLLGPVEIGFGGCLPNSWRWITKYSVNWVIVGGESGHDARPMHPDWVRSIRDQCQEAGVPFFFKQWGEWKPISEMSEGELDALYWPAPVRDPEAMRRCKVAKRAIGYDTEEHWREIDGHMSFPTFKVGKHRSGRLLDGREWNEFPHQEVK